MNNITIIGSGSFGCALAYILGKKNNVKMWSYTKEECDYINNKHTCMLLKDCILDEKIKCYCNYKDALKDSNYVVIAVPSNSINETCESIKPYVKSQEIILATKGINKDKLLSDIVKDILNKMPSIISGPSHAEQIIKEVPTVINYSGNKEIINLFKTQNFNMKYNNDYIGLEVGGSLKNIISIIIGIAEGLNYESNTISYLITEGLKEIKDIGVKLGAKESTFYDLCGLGDLLTTCNSLDSRNKKAGLLLSKNKTLEEIKKELGMTIEGINSLQSAIYLIEKYKLNCPLIVNLYEIIYKQKDIRSLFYI